MQLKLTNINKIKNANIQLNGLTVIAGINDSGKSTVGKILFSVIKAIGNVGNHNEEQQYRKVRVLISRLYILLNSIEKIVQINLKERLSLPDRMNEFVDEVMNGDIQDQSVLDEKMRLIEALDINPSHKVRIQKVINNIKEEAFESKEPQDLLKKELEAMMEAEFLNCVCTNGTDFSEIRFDEETHNTVVEVSLKNNKVNRTIAQNLTDCLINDATFVESPLYMHLLDVLVSAQTLKEKGNRPDLM